MAIKKIAMVTGANRGIGFETTRQLAQLGIETILTSRDREKGLAAANKLKREGLPIHYHQLDVTNEDSIKVIYQDILKKFSRLDILINNAGIYIDEDKTGLNVDLDRVRCALETNALGPLRISQIFIPVMMKHNYGRIVNISSGLGQLQSMNAKSPSYRISKLVLNGITRILSDESKNFNILINAIYPGKVRTKLTGMSGQKSPEDAAKEIINLINLPNSGPNGCLFQDEKQIQW